MYDVLLSDIGEPQSDLVILMSDMNAPQSDQDILKMYDINAPQSDVYIPKSEMKVSCTTVYLSVLLWRYTNILT